MAGLISKARGIIGQRRMERKINTLVRRGGPAIGRSTMSAMAAPLKGSIRRGVDGTNENKSLKRAVKATVGHRLMKAKFDAEQGMKVGFSAGRRTKAVRGSKTSCIAFMPVWITHGGQAESPKCHRSPKRNNTISKSLSLNGYRQTARRRF